MCVTSFVSDWGREFGPWNPKPTDYPTQPWMPTPMWPHPFNPSPIDKTTPAPVYPGPVVPNPTEIERQIKALDMLEEILRRIKALEDAAGGCPCEEPAKQDFSGLRKELEGKLKKDIDKKNKK